MKPTYQQLESELVLSELARTEQRGEIFKLSDDLTEAYDYSEMIQEMNHELRIENIRLESLTHSLDKQIKRGYLQ